MSNASNGQRPPTSGSSAPPSQASPPAAAPPPRAAPPPARSTTGGPPPASAPAPDASAEAELATAPQTALDMEPAIVNAGAKGERNITIEWIPIPMQNATPVRFNVKTAAGNSLTVVLEQLSYRRGHDGTGVVMTSMTPLAPIGTPGQIIANDITTGESVIQRWIWHRIGTSDGGGSRKGFLAWLKELIWKS